MNVASRRVLDAAAQHSRASDAGLLGFLSEERGFMPSAPPVAALPASHAPWDELAAELPVHFRDVSYRKAAARLPLLGASHEELPDAYVRRAATVIGILAHAWFRVETDAPGPLPDALARPWAQVCERLGRPAPFLEFEDITTANWRLIDPAAREPMRVENLDLLVPTVGNDAERFFMMTLVELSARATPLVGTVVRAQECMARDDLAGLERELVALLHTVRGLVDGMGKADPNPYGPTYVDPVVWGVTVAPFAVSINPDMPSPGGTAAPLFQVLDAFLGRRAYDSALGKEVRRLHGVAPPLHRSFIDAVATLPLGTFLERSGTPTLRGLARSLLEIYAGEQGLLQFHRIKAYGYLEVAFKVGRPVTLSGFHGVFRERPWKKVDDALDVSTRERHVDRIPTWVPRATLADRLASGGDATTTVRTISLDVRGQGIVYVPGDRAAVLPENDPRLVAAVIEALRATPNTEVKLTSSWRAALALRRADTGTERLPLADFLRWATLRPLLRPVAKALHALAPAPELGEMIEQRLEDQLELADALEMVAAVGYDTRRLTEARPWEPESLPAIVPPLGERLYSISSAPRSSSCQDELVLTVGDVTYHGAPETGRAAALRRGVASHWLNHHMAPHIDALPVRVVRPRRFRLPEDPAVPIVMFAGGTGISPFLAFLRARTIGRDRSGPNVLFYAARRVDDLQCREELDAWVDDGRLELHLALSQEHGGRRVQEAIDEQADRLWELAGPQGAGVVYICGRGGFAHAVMEELRRLSATRGLADHVRRLVGGRRLCLDVFTTTAPVRAEGPLGRLTVPASELVTRNDDDAGFWLAIDGAVYDVTEFGHLHPGGPQILAESAGTDATEEYRAVLHHVNGEIGAMLAMYKVGLLRRLRLGSGWGVAATTTGFVQVSVSDLYRAWLRYTYLVVEMQNALRNDWLYRTMPLTRGEHEPLTTQKLMLMANTHDRFVAQYLEGSTGGDLVELWRLTTGLCDPDAPMAELSRSLDHVRGRESAFEAAAVATALRGLYDESRRSDPDDTFWPTMDALWTAVREVEERYLAGLKDVLRQGLLLFERHEHDVVERAGRDLVDLLRAVPALVGAGQAGLVAAWRRASRTSGL